MKPSRTPIARGLTACTLAVALAWSWAGQALAQSVYVSSEKDNKVLVFDAAGKLQSKIDVCKRPRHMMFSKDQTKIYVCCGDSNQLGVVDRASGKMVDTVPLGDSASISAGLALRLTSTMRTATPE